MCSRRSVVAVPLDSIVVGGALVVQLPGTGPMAASVFAALFVTPAPAVLERSVSVHVIVTRLPCTALAGDEKFDMT